MVAVCHCPLKVKIQPINLAKTCTTYRLVSEPEVGSCCAARAHYLDLAVTCCVIPVHRESLENWQRRVSAGQWLTSFENCSSRLPKCEGRTVDLAFFFLFIPFDARKQSSNQNDKVRTQRAWRGDYSNKVVFFLYTCNRATRSPKHQVFRRRAEEETVLASRASCVGFVCDVHPSHQQKRTSGMHCQWSRPRNQTMCSYFHND